MIQVFIIADSAIEQMGLAAIVQTDPELQVVGYANQVVRSQLESLSADVVLLSGELSEENLTAVASLLDREALIEDLSEDLSIDRELSIGVIWLVDSIQEQLILEALRLGVLGILPQDVTTTEIVTAMSAVVAGLVVLHPDIAMLLHSSIPNISSTSASNAALTPREVEVLQMLSAGMANKTIARQLFISEHTVKFHISSIFTKLNVSSRTEAVMIGIRQGLILL